MPLSLPARRVIVAQTDSKTYHDTNNLILARLLGSRTEHWIFIEMLFPDRTALYGGVNTLLGPIYMPRWQG